jgi:hypothetical protein
MAAAVLHLCVVLWLFAILIYCPPRRKLYRAKDGWAGAFLRYPDLGIGRSRPWKRPGSLWAVVVVGTSASQAVY